jgi:hypothetical protein
MGLTKGKNISKSYCTVPFFYRVTSDMLILILTVLWVTELHSHPNIWCVYEKHFFVILEPMSHSRSAGDEVGDR